jgi:alkylation response protein AidB-like acyl-CoA dehydrogenase
MSAAAAPGWALGWAGRFETRFADVFAEIGAGTVERERTRALPFDAVEALRASGFTRVSAPVEYGGLGAGPAEVFELLARLGAEDSNLPQIFRSHFALVDRLVATPADPRRDRILTLIGDGAIFGNASHERSSAQVGSLNTKLVEAGDGWSLTGTKYYSTGTLFADWVSVSAQGGDDAGRDERFGVIAPTTAPGVERVDDWRGFGQKMTGSGTTVFDDVRVGEADVQRRTPGAASAPSHDASFLQLVLLATADGIGRAVVRDGVEFVRRRTRVYSHGSGATARQDPIVQETVGELAALSFQAASAVRAAALSIAASHEAQAAGHPDAAAAAAAANEATTAAQLVALPAVLRAATLLFEVGGASATDTALALDRHWRNARTVASHNPARYKARALGEALLTDEPLLTWWNTGESASENVI